MKNLLFRALPHVVAIAIFATISCIYFSPYFDGYSLRQGDIDNYRGMSKELSDFRDKTGEDPLWTNSMFGGMPTYQISVKHSNNWFKVVDKVIKLGLPGPLGVLFMAMLGFYILCLCLKVDPWIAIVGAIGFGMASIFFLFLGAGHTSKMNALAYMAPVLGGVLLTMRGKYLIGAAVTTLFLALHLSANHLQMTYYLLVLLVFAGIAKGIQLILEKDVMQLAKSVGVLVITGVIALMPSLSNLLPTSEYSKYTTRGKTELTVNPDGSEKLDDDGADGLNKDYILEYSLSRGEVFSMVIPNVKGGKSSVVGSDKQLLKSVPKDLRQSIAGMPTYWGSQRFTGGAIYFGAIIFLLFILGMVVVKSPVKWGLFVVVIISVMLSWQEATGLTDFFLENVPMFSKFRDTKMMLVLVQIIMPLMAVLFLDSITKDKEALAKIKMPTLIGGGVVVLLMIVMTVAPTSLFDFSNAQDAQLYDSYMAQASEAGQEGFVNDIFDELEVIRVGIFKADATRSLGFIIIAMILIALTVFKKIDKRVLIPVLGLLVFVDLYQVDMRYLNKEKTKGQYYNFVKDIEKMHPFDASPADQFILQREAPKVEGLTSAIENSVKERNSKYKTKKKHLKQRVSDAAAFGELGLASNYRVFKLGSMTQDAKTSYFHKSFGGYHGAKLKRYQELIEFHLNPEMQKFAEEANKIGPQAAMENMQVVNMLNAEYIIYDDSQQPIPNPMANGNAWFVEDVRMVENANEEIIELGEIDTKKTTLVDQRFAQLISENVQADSSAFIQLDEYKPNRLSYTSFASKEQLAVFSEIYYPAGWKAYIDGTEQEYFRCNYLLRGLMIPAGEHNIEFVFKPKSFHSASTFSLIGSILAFLLIGAGFFFEGRKMKEEIR